MPERGRVAPRGPIAVSLALAAALTWTGAALAQETPLETGARLVATATAISSDEAELSLELVDGGAITLALSGGGAWIDGRRVAEYRPGGTLDLSWRSLLRELTDSPAESESRLLAWRAPSGSDAGERLELAIASALRGSGQTGTAQDAPPAADADSQSLADSLSRLQSRIAELERAIERRERTTTTRTVRTREPSSAWAPFRHFAAGIAQLISTLLVYGVLMAIGFATIYFGGRRYVEAVADTARRSTLRSWAVGFAASFLVIPAYIVGILVLLVSLVGIPALLIWVPVFPVAVGLVLLLGYLGVAHAAGEALAERRFYGGEWFRRANSYYYLFTGLGVLFAFFLASHVVSMAGPLLGFVHGLLVFLSVVVTWAAFTIGLGAVLLSREGFRRARQEGDVPDEPAFEDESHV